MTSVFGQRRHAQGSARSAARRPPQSRRGEEDSLDLPPYEPPKCPLTAQGQQALKELSTSRINEKYKSGLDASAQLLSKSVYAINERLTNRKRIAEQTAERAAKKKNTGDGDGDAGHASVERAERAVKELGEEVSALTAQVEEAMREVLDMQATLQDERGVLAGLPDLVAERQQEVAAQAQQDQEGGGDDDDDENRDPPEVHGVPILDILQQERDSKAAEYERLKPYEKYALNNSYIDFKRSWHQGLYPDEEIPVPDATKWFDQDGRPRHMTREDSRQNGGDDGKEDSDDDIQIAREKRSFTCPLSLSVMKEPYTCRLCKHSFERRFIVEYIKGPNKRGHTAKCPIPGCHVEAMTINDLYLDEALLRRMKRAAQAEREEQERSSDQEEEEEDEVEGIAADTDIKGEAEMEEDE